MKLERIISLTLRVGVVSSALLVVLGLLLFYVEGINSFIPTNQLNAFSVFYGLITGNPESIILLGVMVLIATPIVRVLELFLDYVWSKDRLYIALSLAVLMLMLVGVFLLPIVH
ncbi:MAG: DUF1634 domain-containing protein [Nitrososphaerota archaeon]